MSRTTPGSEVTGTRRCVKRRSKVRSSGSVGTTIDIRQTDIRTDIRPNIRKDLPGTVQDWLVPFVLASYLGKKSVLACPAGLDRCLARRACFPAGHYSRRLPEVWKTYIRHTRHPCRVSRRQRRPAGPSVVEDSSVGPGRAAVAAAPRCRRETGCSHPCSQDSRREPAGTSQCYPAA